MLCFQLYTHLHGSGAVTLSSERPHGLDADIDEIGAILAAHAALTLDAVQRNRRYRSALGSRDLIGQAKGIITERYGLSAEAAFNLLTRLAEQSNKPVVMIAKEIVEGTSNHQT